MLAGFIGGGLLTGLGEGLRQDGIQKREAALRQLELQQQSQREIARDERRAEQQEQADQRRFEQERQLLQERGRLTSQQAAEEEERRARRERDTLNSVVTDRSGELVGVTQRGDTRKLGVSSAAKSGLSAEDKRLFDIVTERFTTEDIEGKRTDFAAVAEQLRRQGRDDLAQIAAPPGFVSDDLREEARRQAEEEASGRTSFFRSRASEFPETSGSKAEFINRRTEEIIRERTGRAPTNTPSDARGSSEPDNRNDTPSVDVPPGAGTNSSPFRATTQAHIDWFRTQAPAGTVIEVNGQLFTK